ncbi:MAG: hypothetical protein J07HQW2_02899, partial [Haloquadratum walsbyi J07HQW2]
MVEIKQCYTVAHYLSQSGNLWSLDCVDLGHIVINEVPTCLS